MADTDSLRELAKAATPGPDGIMVDPGYHHPYCQYYRERSDCTCAEGREPGEVSVPAPTLTALLDRLDAAEAALRALVEGAEADNAAYRGGTMRPLHTLEAIAQARAVLTPRAEQEEDAAAEDAG